MGELEEVAEALDWSHHSINEKSIVCVCACVRGDMAHCEDRKTNGCVYFVLLAKKKKEKKMRTGFCKLNILMCTCCGFAYFSLTVKRRLKKNKGVSINR